MTHYCADFDLTRKVVALTGGGGILGARFARALAERGARVAVIDKDQAKAEVVVASLTGFEAQVYATDVTQREALLTLHADITSDFGPVDILINNAASKSDNFFAPFETFPLDDWHSVMDVNLTGVMLGCQVFGPAMAERGSGSIINLLSIYGIVAPDQRIYEGSSHENKTINTPAVYSVSKAAVWGLTKYLSSYWSAQGVRVNAVTPGGVFSGQNDTFVQRYSARVPLGRMAERDEICGAIVFLAADASSYVTGQNIIVDGGFTVW